MTGIDPTVGTAENYRRFAMHEGAGPSPVYERLAYAVAQEGLKLSFLEGLPPIVDSREGDVIKGR